MTETRDDSPRHEAGTVDDSAIDTRPCPFCAEDIKRAAVLCRYCGHEVQAPNPPQGGASGSSLGAGLSLGNDRAWNPPASPLPGPSQIHPLPHQKTNVLAIVSLVCGILWLFFLALPFGYIARKQVDESKGAQTGRGVAIAGVWVGWVGLVGFLLVIAISVSGSPSNNDNLTTAGNNSNTSRDH